MFGSLKNRIKDFIGKTEEVAAKDLELVSDEIEENEIEPEVPESVEGEFTEDYEPQVLEEGDYQEVETPATIEETAEEPDTDEPEAVKREDEVKVSRMTQLKGMFRKTVRLSEKDLEDLLTEFQMDLIQNDVAMETSEHIIEKLRDRLVETEVETRKINSFVKESIRETLLEILTPEEEVDLLERIEESEKPYVIIFFGVNGTGKTTTISKLARYLTDQGLSVVLAAGDTFRAGAIEQLEKHAQNLELRVIKHQKAGDSAAVIYDAVQHAKARGVDVILADTAGRMQTNVNLMDEMKKICRVNNPDLKIFVGDSLTGNDALEQAEKFNSAIQIDAVILTKMDADAKGGSALSISDVTKRPVIFVGVGQRYEDLKPFDREWFVDQIIN